MQLDIVHEKGAIEAVWRRKRVVEVLAQVVFLGYPLLQKSARERGELTSSDSSGPEVFDCVACGAKKRAQMTWHVDREPATVARSGYRFCVAQC